ncbi:MAG: hypothetical protein UX85_C0001G0235 [Candidatus Beckwithbacteria bacterium GW2011_GWB1_47_15]|uniref:SCP domain-containing protein n=1 Tax=Candidatus Beckwithbacteria bacterium GW2011_GWB1_47_15 TaxID=1618371 RepID=A0A0G1RY36_9BACT|nr:MAG: hypothetical protein UY43_C0001G0890 [Candidatus Beckwithbacteria bacterium GW2011_GWC1_49_16]AQS30873.1 hypothetical protein [uncultured bacterium]KKU36057.1 MAG: hypothetical protein UX50_C0001G0234 [Candidatus Beckwithbacteria bacterium GW2011_GWA1_46_30]KKU62021.1 MAG: hypothetical protein UX85_C0001G0235 [Candidatus Beckwithbacteria bacterium GW2011_GWB1_47_15]KKU72425.1 MAG: hypothetical protein UX97_C0001G0295 [Candidatus Beckwithbacteria bacterium GW2011_GWA2_47_25]OGD50026.1 M
MFAFGLGLWFFQDTLTDLYRQFFASLPRLEQAIEKKVNLPPPLRSEQDSPQAHLTVEGVIAFTNRQRTIHNLPPLAESGLLNRSAAAKAADMLKGQYFAHDSPEGVDVADLAADQGYRFIEIGENLALGNFLDDETLVEAWMDSPGHRENILKGSYREIGVGVIRGTFEGRTTWLAVQHFGVPLSACPGPDGGLAATIEDNKVRLDQLSQELAQRKQELEAYQPKRGPEYEQKVDEYNGLVEVYNQLIVETKGQVEDYNNQVNAFNACVGSL